MAYYLLYLSMQHLYGLNLTVHVQYEFHLVLSNLDSLYA